MTCYDWDNDGSHDLIGFFSTSLYHMTQVVLGAPFLFSSPVSYLRGAFDFGRQFLYQWTVNWRCLPEWLFLHRGFHAVLLTGHIGLLAVFTVLRWTRCDSSLTALSSLPLFYSLTPLLLTPLSLLSVSVNISQRSWCAVTGEMETTGEKEGPR